MVPNKTNFILALQFLSGLVLAFFGFIYLNPDAGSFENLALGTQTSSYQAKDADGKVIHYLHLDSTETFQFESSLNGFKDSATLILGNSQTHSINQLKNNDCNYVELLAKKITDPVFAFSFPNANLQEHLLAFNYALTELKVKKLILPVFMDDLREDGIRAAFFSELYRRHFQIQANQIICKQINSLLGVQKSNEVQKETALPTTQERSEAFLNSYLEQQTSIWPKRETMRGTLFNWLYMLRNTVFGIRPGTARHMITETYQKNFAALNAILDIAKKNKIKVLVYVPPIRSDVNLPYDMHEYSQFQKDLSSLVNKYPNAFLKNFSGIVPGKYWGYKEPTNFIDKREIDYMHFQFAGHQILADSLMQFLKN